MSVSSAERRAPTGNSDPTQHGSSARPPDLAFTKRLTIYSAAAVISLVAWVLNVQQLYWMAGSLFLLPQVSRWFGKLEHRGLEAERAHAGAGHQGEIMPVRWRLRNRTRLPKLQLFAADELPAGLAPVVPEPVPVHLPPEGTDEVGYELRLGRRGLHALPSVRFTSVDVLGLYPVETHVPCETRLIVYPRVIELPERLLPPERGGGEAPLSASRKQGEGAGFYGIREYRPGDPLRHVHWRTAARLGRLTVVEWEAEESVDALLAVETLRGSERTWEDGTSLDAAAGLAASLAAYILGAGDSVRVLAPGTTEWKPAADRGMGAMANLLESLARMEAVAETSLATELRESAGQLAPGTLVCWLTPQPGSGLVETARFLRTVHLRPVVYALVSQELVSAWSGTQAELEAAGIPVVSIGPQDPIIQQLMG